MYKVRQNGRILELGILYIPLIFLADMEIIVTTISNLLYTFRLYIDKDNKVERSL